MHLRLPACVLSLVLVAPTAAAPQSPDYRATTTIEARQASPDGRFAVLGQARLVPAAQSADHRYVLKASAASCDPSDDRLFGNGFETP